MIFIISLIINIIALILERLVGIGWDFHVDSVTYIESISNYELKSIFDNNFKPSTINWNLNWLSKNKYILTIKQLARFFKLF